MRTISFPLMAVLAIVMLSACSTPKQPPMPLGDLKIGVGYFTHPRQTADLFAGYMTDETPPVEEKILNEMDSLFSSVLAANSKVTFQGRDSALHCSRTLGKQETRQAALRRWSAIGRCMNVDLLVVPQLLEWRERDGSDLGVVTPAKVVMDIYIIDVNNESLISRSRYDETQSSLSANLLETKKFFKRGAKWVRAQELAEEGMEKAIKELGL